MKGDEGGAGAGAEGGRDEEGGVEEDAGRGGEGGRREGRERGEYTEVA